MRDPELPRTPLASRSQPPSPTLAVALAYDPQRDLAPSVVASGRDWLASEICRVAEASDVAIREDAALATLLASVEVDQSIPEEAYAAVAAILACLYRLGDAGASARAGAEASRGGPER